MSAAYRARVSRAFGDDFEIAVLSEMRRSSTFGLLAALRRVRAREGLVFLEDGGSTPLAPALKLLISLSGCSRLGIVDDTLRPSWFSRVSGLLEAPALAWATGAGLWSALLCYVELRRLGRAAYRTPPHAGSLQRAAFLRTNLWFGLKAGGSVGHIAGVINSLVRRCEHVDVLTRDPLPTIGPGADITLVPGARHHGYPYELNYYSYHRRFVARAAGILRRTRPGFLYHRLSLGSYAGVSLARTLGVPLVLEYNGSEVWVASHWGTPLRFPALARLAEDVPIMHADVITTVSDVLGDELRGRGVPAERIVVHPNGVDPAIFDPERFTAEDRNAIRARHGIGHDDVVCTFVGTFGRWHGVVLLAEAIRALVSSDASWVGAHRVRFLLVGDGMYMSAVRQTIGECAHVTLTGLVPQESAPAYLAASDILLSPHVPNPDGSRFFGSPTKLFEYMAMSKAIVASDLEQIGQVLQPSARASALPPSLPSDTVAILTTPGSAEELLTAIRFLVPNRDIRDQLGRNARKRVLDRYTWDHNVSAVLGRMRELYGTR